MKKLIQTIVVTALAVAFINTTQAEHHKVHLSDNLKPLEWLIGHWTNEGESNQGMKWKSESKWTVAVGGHAIVREGKLSPEGQDVILSKTIYTYDNARKAIVNLYIDNRGWTSTGQIWVSESKMITRWNGSTPEGGTGVGTNIIEKIDNDSVKYQEIDRVYDGQVMEDGTAQIAKRKK